MKRLIPLFLALLMALSLCACGGGDDLGTYYCTSIVMSDVNLGNSGEWIELKEEGKASIYLSGQKQNAEYTLEEDGAFTLTINGVEVGTGTVSNGTLTMEYSGMTCIFEQEAQQ